MNAKLCTGKLYRAQLRIAFADVQVMLKTPGTNLGASWIRHTMDGEILLYLGPDFEITENHKRTHGGGNGAKEIYHTFLASDGVVIGRWFSCGKEISLDTGHWKDWFEPACK